MIMDEIIGLFKSDRTSLSPASSTAEKELATEDVIDFDHPTMKEEEGEISGLEALPAEIITQILTFLPPVALADLSRTSTLLRSHAHNDLLWLNIVRANVPNGNSLDSPSPARSWRHLYVSHHPYWFLARHKIWFADVPNTGKIIIARYNNQRGCIEAYQLIAEHGAHTFEHWTHNNDVIIHSFNPKVRLWTDDPVVMLGMGNGNDGRRLRKEVPMHTGSTHGICSMISLCQPIPKSLQDPSMALWPPNIVPSEQRVRNASVNKFRSEAHRPQSLDLMSNQTFRVRKWLEFSNLMQPLNSVRMGEEVMTFSTLLEETYTPTKEKPYQGIWVGDYSGHGCEFLLVLQQEVISGTTMSRQSSTGSLPEGVSIAQMEAETPEQRDAGIRLIVDEAGAEVPPEAPSEASHHHLHVGPSTEVPERMAEPESNYTGLSSSSKAAAESINIESDVQSSYPDDGFCGRLEAIKLTGDINVPRGQHTWIAEDIGPKGVIRIGKEQMFKDARMVKSWGRIAGRGFRHDRFIPSQLILISHDTIAQYWEVSRYRDQQTDMSCLHDLHRILVISLSISE